MNKNNIKEKLQSVFVDVFDDEDLRISNSTNSDDIEEWDSLNHIALVLSIEKCFNIRFMTGEVISLKDVGEMIQLLEEKTSMNS
jgi:acyl carrier protein